MCEFTTIQIILVAISQPLNLFTIFEIVHTVKVMYRAVVLCGGIAVASVAVTGTVAAAGDTEPCCQGNKYQY